MSNLEQRNFNEPPAIINASEPHMALVFVLDTSGSMAGTPIDQLNKGLNRFKEEVCRDKQTCAILDVAVIEFNNSFKVLGDGFVPVEYMEHINLTASGGTHYTAPIREALKKVNERSRFYRSEGTEPYKPWILLVTDGAPLDDISGIAKEIQDAEESGKVRFISLGVEGYDSKALHTLSNFVFRLEGTDFSSFFNWVSKSMRSVSQSSPGEKPKLPPLEGNVYRDVSDL